MELEDVIKKLKNIEQGGTVHPRVATIMIESLKKVKKYEWRDVGKFYPPFGIPVLIMRSNLTYDIAYFYEYYWQSIRECYYALSEVVAWKYIEEYKTWD